MILWFNLLQQNTCADIVIGYRLIVDGKYKFGMHKTQAIKRDNLQEFGEFIKPSESLLETSLYKRQQIIGI